MTSLTDQPVILVLAIIAGTGVLLFAISKYKRMKVKMRIPHVSGELSGDAGAASGGVGSGDQRSTRVMIQVPV